MYVCVVLKRQFLCKVFPCTSLGCLSYCKEHFTVWRTNPTTFFENGVSDSDSRRQAYKSIIKDWEVSLESEKSGVFGSQ